MELILSRPITKMQVYLCAGLLTLAGMFALVMVMFLGTVTAVNIYDFGEPIPLRLFFRIAINGGLLASTAGALALLAAANYFVSIISQLWPRMYFTRHVTLFNYVNGPRVWVGWPLRDMAVLAGTLLVAAVAGGIIWHRRDLPL